ncbi:MAG: lysophospholipid acyltransferase family protein [Polyangiales bacterium]
MADDELTPARPDPATALMRALADARASVVRRVDDAVDRRLGADALDRLARIDVPRGSSGVDPFGFDPAAVRYALLAARALYRDWFRAEVRGMENVPDGRVLLISNHSGQVPLDGLAIATSLLLDREPPRLLRSMVERWSATLPFVSVFFPRMGQIVGVPENCQRLLERDEAILVFPEGSRGISKPFSERYRLTEFGSGFMRLALATQSPIVPVAVVGAEEQYISVANLTRLAKLMGAPAFPVIPQLLLPGGFLPVPVKYRLHFGEPMHFTGDPDDEDAVIEEKAQLVRATVQSMVNRGLKERRGIFR